MADPNKRNIQYFESQSMRDLYGVLQAWQEEHSERFLSLDIKREGDRFCCIALTNPMEVIIADGSSSYGADVTGKALKVYMD